MTDNFMKHYTKLNKDHRRKLYKRGRFCSRCGKKYIATGKYSRICPDCNRSGEHWKQKRLQQR